MRPITLEDRYFWLTEGVPTIVGLPENALAFDQTANKIYTYTHVDGWGELGAAGFDAASPGPIGGTTPSTGKFTTIDGILNVHSTVSQAANGMGHLITQNGPENTLAIQNLNSGAEKYSATTLLATNGQAKFTFGYGNTSTALWNGRGYLEMWTGQSGSEDLPSFIFVQTNGGGNHPRFEISASGQTPGDINFFKASATSSGTSLGTTFVLKLNDTLNTSYVPFAVTGNITLTTDNTYSVGAQNAFRPSVVHAASRMTIAQNEATASTNALEVFGTGSFGAGSTIVTRNSLASGWPLFVMNDEGVANVLYAVKNNVVGFKMTIGTTPLRLDFVDPDHSSVVPLSLALDGSGNITSVGTVELSTADAGVNLKSANGTRYKLTVSNSGVLTTTAL